MLYLAMFLVLPKFVKFLLETHDLDHKAEEFNNIVSLAYICVLKPYL